MESQVREQRGQLVKRAESVQKIRDAQGSLDGRIGELEITLENVQQMVEALRQQLGSARAHARGLVAESVGLALPEPDAEHLAVSAEDSAFALQRVSA
jgi:hypothetical protein